MSQAANSPTPRDTLLSLYSRLVKEHTGPGRAGAAPLPRGLREYWSWAFTATEHALGVTPEESRGAEARRKYEMRDLHGAASSAALDIQRGLQEWLPFVAAESSGVDESNPIVTIKLALSPRQSWPNGIFHNAEWAIFFYDPVSGDVEYRSGALPPLPGQPKFQFRKTTAKNAQEALDKLNRGLKPLLGLWPA